MDHVNWIDTEDKNIFLRGGNKNFPSGHGMEGNELGIVANRVDEGSHTIGAYC